MFEGPNGSWARLRIQRIRAREHVDQYDPTISIELLMHFSQCHADQLNTYVSICDHMLRVRNLNILVRIAKLAHSSCVACVAHRDCLCAAAPLSPTFDGAASRVVGRAKG